MVKVALTGGAYQAHSVIASAQRCVNLFPEPMPTGNQYTGSTGQGEPSTHAHYPTPGIRLLGVIGAGPIRGIRQCTTGGVYVVSGSEVYSINTSAWTGTLLGSITSGLHTPVSMQDNGLDMIVVDGTANGWTVSLASNAFAQISDPSGMFSGADRVDYLDTYFLLNKPATPQFYISGSLAVTFDPLDFANKEAYSDLLVTVIVSHRLLYLLGERTGEVWYDAGATFSTTDPTVATSFQFAPMQSMVFIDHGCAAKYSPAEYDNRIYWLTKDRQGQGIVMFAEGEKTSRVSTYAIEAEIAGYATISDAIGFCYQLSGHTFYVLTFPQADKTWSYDITSGQWHEWLWIDANGAEHRHRANCYWAVNELGVVGDWQNGNLYALDNRVFTDNGSPIKRVRAFPHMLADGKRVFYRQFLADMETGTAPEMLSGTEARLDATFTAPDGTNLSSYTSEVGGGWTAVGGEANAQISSNTVVGTGGAEALYQSAATILTPDYTLHFDVVPPVAGSVVSANTVWAIGRAAGANTGYRVAVAADGTQYTLTLATLPSGASASVAMGTIASGRFTVWLLLRGANITAQVQRSIDAMWLRTAAAWHSDPGTIAAQFTDATYTTPGTIMLGGTWPAPPPGLTTTYETPLATDPNFPTGYTPTFTHQAFDFGRNLFYQPIADATNNGIVVTDLSTMHVIQTVTAAQMYAGTGFAAQPAVMDAAAGINTDLYLITGPDSFTRYFVRVNPATMKVTGQLFGPGVPGLSGAAGDGGVVSTTATHTIVAYRSLGGGSFSGPLIYDGTGMAFIAHGPVPLYNNSLTSNPVIVGAKHGDGSCDFLMINSDDSHATGNIDIWRINVSDGLTITNTKTGTLNVNAIFSTPSNYIAQADYDAAHDRVILQLCNSSTTGPPVWVVAANLNGSVAWSTYLATDLGMPSSKGQSLLTGNTLMLSDGGHLKLLNTSTGAITSPGTVDAGGSYYRVYDSGRLSYWVFSPGVHGFTRISMPTAPMLAIDNLIATAQQTLLSTNLVSLRWSDDRGHSYGSPVTIPMGDAGEYRTSLQYQRLGMARDRCFELSWSVPCRVALQGAWIDLTPAQS